MPILCKQKRLHHWSCFFVHPPHFYIVQMKGEPGVCLESLIYIGYTWLCKACFISGEDAGDKELFEN